MTHLCCRWLSPAALDLAERLLAYDPAERVTAAQAQEAPYFTEEGPPPALPVGCVDVAFCKDFGTNMATGYLPWRVNGTNWRQSAREPKSAGKLSLRSDTHNTSQLLWVAYGSLV